LSLRYYLIYKPYQVLTQFGREADKASLADHFHVPRDVYPVGRLDYDSEGLLILTNDKSLNHRLLNPRFAHEREYWVQVDGAVTPAALEQLQRGVRIAVDGKPYHTQGCQAFFFEEEPAVPPRNPPTWNTAYTLSQRDTGALDPADIKGGKEPAGKENDGSRGFPHVEAYPLPDCGCYAGGPGTGRNAGINRGGNI